MTSQDPRKTICLYCRGDSSKSVRDDHAVPQAIFKNDSVFPERGECDDCNSTLGGLDNNLVQHPMVALALQAFRVPGRDGKPRENLGGITISEDGNWLYIPVDELFTDHPTDGDVSVSPLVAPTYDDRKFARSLLRLALNVYALKFGTARALAAELDLVRRYVRYGEGPSNWDFVEHLDLGDGWAPRFHAGFPRGPGSPLADIRIGGVRFLVHLLRRDDVLKAEMRCFFPKGNARLRSSGTIRSKRPTEKRVRLRLDIGRSGAAAGKDNGNGTLLILDLETLIRYLLAVSQCVTREGLDRLSKLVWRHYSGNPANDAALAQLRTRIETQRAIMDRNDPQ